MKRLTPNHDSAPPINLSLAFVGDQFFFDSPALRILDSLAIGYPRKGRWHNPAITIQRVWKNDQQILGARETSQSDTEEYLRFGRWKGSPGHPATPSDLAGRSSSFLDIRRVQFRFEVHSTILSTILGASRSDQPDAILIAQALSSVASPHPNPGPYERTAANVLSDLMSSSTTNWNNLPCFIHGPICCEYEEALSAYYKARDRGIRLMARTALSACWRMPDLAPMPKTVLQLSILIASNPAKYGLHSLIELFLWVLFEIRELHGHVTSVETLRGEVAWKALSDSLAEPLIGSALSRSDEPLGKTTVDGRMENLGSIHILKTLVPDPIVHVLRFDDGSIGMILFLEGAIQDITFGAHTCFGSMVSTQLHTGWGTDSICLPSLMPIIEEFLFFPCSAAASDATRISLAATAIAEALGHAAMGVIQPVDLSRLQNL